MHETGGRGGAKLPNDKAAPKELKVTDKRIFTPEGEIRDEFKQEIHPRDPQAAAPAAPPQPQAPPADAAPAQASAPPRPERPAEQEPAAPPNTPFTGFVYSLLVQGYMYLGMSPDRNQPAMKPEPAAAREMIEILVMLQEKTVGNLIPGESDFLTTAISELKLAYVQRTKKI